MYEFDNCVAASKSGAELASGNVISYENGKFKIKLREVINILPSENINLFVYNRLKGECVYSAKVESLDGEILLLGGAEFVRSTQKRENTRVYKLLNYNITHKFTSDGIKRLDSPIPITIVNISANGMYIQCNEKLVKGGRFPFVFREAGKPISLDVEVIRCEMSRRGNRYGCRFVNISDKDADNIYRFVLHEQIEQRRRMTLL